MTLAFTADDSEELQAGYQAVIAGKPAPTEPEYTQKKAPQKRGQKGCSSHAFGRLSIT